MAADTDFIFPEVNITPGTNGISSGGFDLDFGNIAAGGRALGSLLQGFAGLKQAKIAKEQTRLAELFGRANFDASAKAFNERLRTRAISRRNRPSFEDGGLSVADVLSRFGVGDLDGGLGSAAETPPSSVSRDPGAAPAELPTNASPTAGIPTPQRRRPVQI